MQILEMKSSGVAYQVSRSILCSKERDMQVTPGSAQGRNSFLNVVFIANHGKPNNFDNFVVHPAGTCVKNDDQNRM
jgi:hypothetical protein